MESTSFVTRATDDNGAAAVAAAQGQCVFELDFVVLLFIVYCNGGAASDNCLDAAGGRIGEVKRVTKETNVSVKINLDGDAVAENNTGIPFLDHMLDVSFFRLIFSTILFVVGLLWIQASSICFKLEYV